MEIVQQLSLAGPDNFLQFLNFQSYGFVVSHRNYKVGQLFWWKLQLKSHCESWRRKFDLAQCPRNGKKVSIKMHVIMVAQC